jgi:hypothetical protein
MKMCEEGNHIGVNNTTGRCPGCGEQIESPSKNGFGYHQYFNPNPTITDTMEIIKNLMDVAEVLKSGQINIDDTAKIIAYVKEFQKMSLDAMRRADTAEIAAKKLLTQFEFWKNDHLCIPRNEIETILDNGGKISSPGQIIVMKVKSI